MAHTIKTRIAKLTLLILALTAGIVHAQPSIPVGLYVDCEKPAKLNMAFRNRGGEFTIPTGLLPWNSIFSMRIKAFSLVNGEATPLALYAPVADHMSKTRVPANEVVSGALNFNDVIKDFEKVATQSDIVIAYSLATRAIAQTPSFKTAPTVVIIPKRTASSKGCALVAPMN